MKVGDLVEVKDDSEDYDGHLGTILKFDMWCPDERNKLWSPLGLIRGTAPIVEVYWNTGQPGWILKSRLRKVD
jgi:hypothetical protein